MYKLISKIHNLVMMTLEKKKTFTVFSRHPCNAYLLNVLPDSLKDFPFLCSFYITHSLLLTTILTFSQVKGCREAGETYKKVQAVAFCEGSTWLMTQKNHRFTTGK